MSGDLPPWVSAFDRVPVRYSPPHADDGTKSQAAPIPLARHRRRSRRRRALALLHAAVLRVLAAVTGHRRAGVPSAR